MSKANIELVSVIIPNFNYAHFLEESVNSVLAQTYSNIELIVVDDGSTDNSLEVLSQISGKILVIESPNRGSCVARNLGMAEANGLYIAFLDADDAWDPEKIERQVKRLEESNADLVFCQMRAYGEDANSSIGFTNIDVDHEWFLKNPGATPFSPSVAILTRELASRVGGWNTNLTGPAEDFDYFRRCAKLGRIVSLNEILVSHRQHSGSLTSASTLRYFEDNLRVLKIMFDEDKSKINFLRMAQLWMKFHLNFFKHSLKVKNCNLFLRVVVSLLNPSLNLRYSYKDGHKS